jgi:hypothetical protein
VPFEGAPTRFLQPERQRVAARSTRKGVLIYELLSPSNIQMPLAIGK